MHCSLPSATCRPFSPVGQRSSTVDGQRQCLPPPPASLGAHLLLLLPRRRRLRPSVRLPLLWVALLLDSRLHRHSHHSPRPLVVWARPSPVARRSVKWGWGGDGQPDHHPVCICAWRGGGGCRRGGGWGCGHGHGGGGRRRGVVAGVRTFFLSFASPFFSFFFLLPVGVLSLMLVPGFPPRALLLAGTGPCGRSCACVFGVLEKGLLPVFLWTRFWRDRLADGRSPCLVVWRCLFSYPFGCGLGAGSALALAQAHSVGQ